MMQLALFADIPDFTNKNRHGAVWWCGNWECRNFHGYFQSREVGSGAWCFQVPWFSIDDVTCTVYRVGKGGELVHENFVPIDDKGQLTILGRKYGREHWNH